MASNLTIILFSMILTLVLISVLRPVAVFWNLVDSPDRRKKHNVSVPLVGGLAIYIAVFVTSIAFFDEPVLLNALMVAGVLAIVGLVDDCISLKVGVRLFWQAVTSIGVIGISNVVVWDFGFSSVRIGFDYQIIAVGITVFVVVLAVNVSNMVDGIDGLAAGQFLIVLGSVALTLFSVHGEIYRADLLGIAAGSTIGFMVVNIFGYPIKPVFLGDCGSLMLGFAAIWLLILYSQPPLSLISPIAALWIVTLPVLDAVVVVLNRLSLGKSPFSPDRTHLHHRLVDSGRGKLNALITILGSSIFLAAGGIYLTYFISELFSFIIYCLVMTAGVGLSLLKNKLNFK